MNLISKFLYSISVTTFMFTLIILTGIWNKNSNNEIKYLLERPGPIEQWSDGTRQASPNSFSPPVSPLVRQAEIYALLLNPPKTNSLNRKSSYENRASPIPRPLSVRPNKITPKFKVYATSVYPADPDKSMALISEPGKGFRWVRQGDKLGYLIVHEIKNGEVVYQDGVQMGKVAWELQDIESGRLSLTDKAAKPLQGVAMDLPNRP